MGTRTLIPTNEELTDSNAHTVVRCSWCERYFDPDTKEYKPKPEKDCGDSICPECMTKMMEGLNNDGYGDSDKETC